MSYGLCHTCGAQVIGRTRGAHNSVDTCERGHKNPARLTVSLGHKDEVARLRRLVVQAYVEGVGAGCYGGVTPEQATDPMHLPSTDWFNWLNDPVQHSKEGGE